MDAQDELNTLMPQPLIVTAGGESIEITPIRTGQLPPLLRAIGPLLKGGLDGLDRDVADWITFVGLHGEAVAEAVAVAIKKPRDWVDELEPLELMTLAFAVLEVNRDFFTRQVLPALEKLNQTLGRIGLPGLDLPSPLDSPPAS